MKKKEEETSVTAKVSRKTAHCHFCTVLYITQKGSFLGFQIIRYYVSTSIISWRMGSSADMQEKPTWSGLCK